MNPTASEAPRAGGVLAPLQQQCHEADALPAELAFHLQGHPPPS